MAEIPQLNETQPVLNQQSVSSTATSHEAFAQVLGNIAGEAGHKAEQIAEDQSQSMYINSVANIEQLKTSAQMQMLEHPDQASKVSDTMLQASDMVKQAAFVNDKDRTRLNAYISGAVDDVALAATKTNVHQTQLMAAYTHYANWPSQLKAYEDALMKDPDKADQLKDGMISSLKSLVSIGALTPHEAGASIKTISDKIDVQQQYIRDMGNPNFSARDYHTNTSSLHPKSPQEMANAPIDENTGWLTNHYTNDRSFQGVLADLYNHTVPNLQTYYGLQPSQREHAALTRRGVMEADGLINSGTPLPYIQNVYDGLNQKGQVLSYKDQALRTSLGSYLNKLKNGNYLETIQSTPAGASILQNFTSRKFAIDNSPISDTDKGKLHLDNLNNMVNQAVSYGYANHMQPSNIQPIPKGIVDNVEAGFQVGNDPSVVLQSIGQFRNENRPWLAQAMKKPEQKVVVNTVALAGDFVKPSDLIDYVAANQVGRDFTKINEGQEKTALSDPKLNGLIATTPAFQDAMTVVRNQYDPIQTQQIQANMIKTAANYVKYLAQKSGDFTMKNKDTYIQQASNIVSNAYPKMSSTNYIANPRQLNLTPSEMDVLARYAINQGYNFLKEGVKEEVFMSAVDRNQLKMTLSPTNEIMAVDGNNKVYWHAPFTTTLMGAARKFQQQQDQDAAKLQNELNTMRYGAGNIP